MARCALLRFPFSARQNRQSRSLFGRKTAGFRGRFSFFFFSSSRRSQYLRRKRWISNSSTRIPRIPSRSLTKCALFLRSLMWKRVILSFFKEDPVINHQLWTDLNLRIRKILLHHAVKRSSMLLLIQRIFLLIWMDLMDGNLLLTNKILKSFVPSNNQVAIHRSYECLWSFQYKRPDSSEKGLPKALFRQSLLLLLLESSVCLFPLVRCYSC